MNSIGKKAIIASKKKINSKEKNKVLDRYINLIKKNKKLIINKNRIDIKLALRKKLSHYYLNTKDNNSLDPLQLELMYHNNVLILLQYQNDMYQHFALTYLMKTKSL